VEVLDGTKFSAKRGPYLAIAAIAGIRLPALLTPHFIIQDAVRSKAGRVPAATDIAFALGVLVYSWRALPITLKLFFVVCGYF